jgi:2-polyprenyl-3-methyl-5-hydroxy-6-metoxy-1,4-benzoquinol methylase
MCGAPGGLYVEAFGDTLHRCRRCGLIYLFPYPDKNEMVRRHQTEAYASHPYFAAGDEAAGSGAGFGLHRWFLSLLARHIVPGSRVLDVGAGTGDFVQLGSSIYRMSAVEPSPYLAERIRRRAAGDVFEGAFEDFVPSEPYDAVLLMDMIEHAADPRALLRHARGVLRQGGILFVCTVDSGALLYRLGRTAWHASRVSAKAGYLLHRIFCQQHNWYFNRRVLGQVVSDAGLDTIDHQGYEFPLDRLRENPVVVGGLRAVYLAQSILGAKTEQYLIARKPE